MLAGWFKAEWAEHYGARSRADIERDFREMLNTRELPIGLVAVKAGEVVAGAVLRERALAGFAQYAPGLGGLFVAAGHRRQGIASELVRAAWRMANGMGHEELYAATAHAGALFERLGWLRVADLRQGGAALALYRVNVSSPRRD